MKIESHQKYLRIQEESGSEQAEVKKNEREVGSVQKKPEAPSVSKTSGHRQPGSLKRAAVDDRFESVPDPQADSSASKAIADGYTPQQIQEARRKIEQGKNIKKLAEDPLAMMLATPEEKSKLIKKLSDSFTSDAKDRAIVSILSSAKDKGEFEKIIEGTGKDLGKILDDGQAEKKYNLLCGAYDRIDLASDPKTAEKASGILTDQQKARYYSGNNATAGTSGGAAPFTAVNNADLRTQTDGFISQQQSKIQSRVSDLDRRAEVDTILENAMREKDGKPFINSRNLREQANTIMSDSNLSAEERKKKVNELRKEQGLSKYSMRNIVTQPMAHAYNRAAEETSGYSSSVQSKLANELKVAESTYGKQSPQAQGIREKMGSFQSQIAPFASHLSQTGKTLQKMYPPPQPAAAKIFGFLGNMLKTFAPAVLNVIPGAGNALYAGYQIGAAIYKAAKGNFMGMVSGIAGALPGVGSAIGGVAGKGLQIAGKVGQSSLQMGKSIKEKNISGVLGAVGGMAGSFSGINSNADRILGNIKKGLNAASNGASMMKGIASGDLHQIMGNLNQLGSMVASGAEAPKILDRMKNLAMPGTLLSRVIDSTKRGYEFVNSMRNGNFGSALNQVRFFREIMNGRWSERLQGFANGLAEFGSSPAIRNVTAQTLNLVRAANAAGKGIGSRLPQEFVTNSVPEVVQDPAVRNAMEYAALNEQLISEMANGNFRNAWRNLATQAVQFSQSDHFQELIDSARDAGESLQHHRSATQLHPFVQSIADGSYVSELEAYRSELLGLQEWYQALDAELIKLEEDAQDVLEAHNDLSLYLRKEYEKLNLHSESDQNLDEETFEIQRTRFRIGSSGGF